MYEADVQLSCQWLSGWEWYNKELPRYSFSESKNKNTQALKKKAYASHESAVIKK